MKYFTILILSLSFMNCSNPKTYPTSDHYNSKKGTFFNPTLEKQSKSLSDILKWKFTTTAEDWPEFIPLTSKPNLKPPIKENEVNLSFINHSTFLLQLKGINILTDPVYSERVSPISFLGPKRVHDPGVPLKNLPPIQVVIISHNHYDHLDLETLKKLEEKFKPIFIAPLGDETLLQNEGLTNIIALDWYQNYKVHDTEIIFTPTQHWSRRGLLDTNKSLWGGYIIRKADKKIYFGGDAGYSKYYKEIFNRYGAMDLSLLPIGAYAPRWFMQDMHMDPEEAIWAHQDLKSRKSIGIHFGTFQLTNESREEPTQKLQIHLRSQKISPDDFMVLEPGQSHVFSM